jgi:putative heme-binding domain-containing protein
MRVGAILALCALCIAARGASAQEAEEQPPALSGKAVYETFCLACHGPRGQGGPLGKSLLDAQAMSLSDGEMISLIELGRPDAGMASFMGALSKEEIAGAMAYIRELQGRSAQRTTRTAQAPAAEASEIAATGEALFNGKARCIECHSYNFMGGWHGPDLSEIARRMSREQLREALTNPSASIAEGYPSKVIVTGEGETILGRVRNESRTALQLLNEDGTLWTTYFKDTLKSAADAKESYMPAEAFTSLSEDEQDALLTFLETLR